MSWVGAGVPVLGSGLILSGTTAIVVRAGSYTIEYEHPGREGGDVEYFGKPQERIEIHGMDFRSGASERLALLSGYSHTFQNLVVPSFNPGSYFFNAGVYIEKLEYWQTAGYAYPFYKWRIIATTSGGELLVTGAFDPLSFDYGQSGYAFDTAFLITTPVVGGVGFYYGAFYMGAYH